jgi:hypothetical protein
MLTMGKLQTAATEMFLAHIGLGLTGAIHGHCHPN